jgi:N-acetylglucosamine kinase-like BadF-type ATPase
MRSPVHPPERIALGIDAGGTATRACAVLDRRVVHEGSSGPGNPLAVDGAALLDHYEAALAGCPEPAVVAACVAGAGDPRARAHVEQLLRVRFPRSPVHVLPDYAAAWAAAPEEVDAVIVAGTGSIVCTRRGDGTFRVSGGLGWVIGDHGSAARLGRALLDWHGSSYPEPVPPFVVEALGSVYGTAEARLLARALGAAPAPAAYLARSAPALTAAAGAGHAHARELVAAEMRLLAATTASHLGDGGRRVALAGGVWRSDVCREAFAAALAELAAGSTTTLTRRRPVEGAVLLAEELAR